MNNKTSYVVNELTGELTNGWRRRPQDIKENERLYYVEENFDHKKKWRLKEDGSLEEMQDTLTSKQKVELQMSEGARIFKEIKAQMISANVEASDKLNGLVFFVGNHLLKGSLATAQKEVDATVAGVDSGVIVVSIKEKALLSSAKEMIDTAVLISY